MSVLVETVWMIKTRSSAVQSVLSLCIYSSSHDVFHPLIRFFLNMIQWVRVNYIELHVHVRNNLQVCYSMWAIWRTQKQPDVLNVVVSSVETVSSLQTECCDSSTNSVSFNFQNPTPAGGVRVKQVTHFIHIQQIKSVHLMFWSLKSDPYTTARLKK